MHAAAPAFTAGWSCVISCGFSLQTGTFVLWWDNELGRKLCCLIKVRFQHSAGEYMLVGRSSIWRRCAEFESGGELQFFPSQLPLVQIVRSDSKETRLETGSRSFPGLAKILSSILANRNGKGNVLLSARVTSSERSQDMVGAITWGLFSKWTSSGGGSCTWQERWQVKVSQHTLQHKMCYKLCYFQVMQIKMLMGYCF